MGNIGADGKLSPMSTSVVGTGGTQPAFIRFDPTGHHAYVTNFSSGNSGTVAHFTVDANGLLTAANPFTVATGKGPSMITVDRAGKFTDPCDGFCADRSGDYLLDVAVGVCGARPPVPRWTDRSRSDSALSISSSNNRKWSLMRFWTWSGR
jgi:DNA-binding beta-propeller fold protein YncE